MILQSWYTFPASVIRHGEMKWFIGSLEACKVMYVELTADGAVE
jgi:hypothetical protein